MWRRKKPILIMSLALAVLVGSVAGVALAQTGTGGSGQSKTLFARVAAILGIDQQKLESAFAQARREMQEEALDNYLKNLIDQGKITQEQADQYKKWWQARPDMEPFRQQLRAWQQARPDIPLPGPFGGPGFHGMKRGGGHAFWGR